MRATAEHPQSQKERPFPINLSVYDRDPTFSTQELTALQMFISMRNAGRHVQWYPEQTLGLHRAVQPVLDVFRIIDGVPKTDRQKDTVRWAITILLREMHQRQTPFWAWTEQEWEEILCASQKIFIQRYRFHTSTRTRLITVAYTLGNFCNFEKMGFYRMTTFAVKIFGQEAVDQAMQPILTLLKQTGYGETALQGAPCGICELLLANRSPYLEDLTLDILAQVHHRLTIGSRTIKYIHAISRALAHLRIIEKPLAPDVRWKATQIEEKATAGIAPEWVSWCKRWRATTTLQPMSVKGVYYQTLTAGRWLAEKHPELLSPEQWTRELSAEYVAAINHMTVGQRTSGITPISSDKLGKPISAATKANYLGGIRTFFRDLQEWGWIPRRFDVMRVFATPKSVNKLLGPNPRVIADDIWAKLLTAGLNLKMSDLPTPTYGKEGTLTTAYPLSMIQSVVVVWLFAGLRRNEICRLRLGCIR